MQYDYSNADQQKSQFDLIPNKSVVPVIVSIQKGDPGTPENAFKLTKSGLYQLRLELTVTEGDFAKRKIWHSLIMGAKPGIDLTEGQAKAVNISRASVRAFLEAGRGVSPTDESEKAINARKMETIFELEGLECWIEVGIEKGAKKEDSDEKYDDQNRVNKVMPWKDGQSKPGGGQQQMSLAPSQQTAAPSKAKVTKPSWA